jgi:hypothetical protein
MMLQSRFASALSLLLPALLFGVAAAPDFLDLKGWPAFAGVMLLWLAVEGFGFLVRGSEVDGYRSTFMEVGDLISSLAGFQSQGAGGPNLVQDPDRAIDTLLRRARDLAIASLKPPAGCNVTANLLLPEWNEHKAKWGSLRLAREDDWRPNRTHEPIPLDAPGAGRTFNDGVAVGIASTEKESHPRIRGKSYKTVGTFPISVGDKASNGRVVAVLSLDADVPNVFTQKAVDKLHPFVSPIAQLIGLALVTKTEGFTHE